MSHPSSPADTSSPRSLTEEQAAFLAALDEETQNGRKTGERASRVEPSRLARWLGDRAFRRRLRDLLRGVRHGRELCLEVATSRAAERLALELDAEGAAETARRRAWIDLLKLVRRPRRRPAQRASRAPESAGVHPDVNPGEVADLVRRLG